MCNLTNVNCTNDSDDIGWNRDLYYEQGYPIGFRIGYSDSSKAKKEHEDKLKSIREKHIEYIEYYNNGYSKGFTDGVTAAKNKQNTKY